MSADAFEAALLDIWDSDPAHDIAHIHRVWRNARDIVAGDGLEVDMTVLRAAVVFHDLVNLPKDAPDRAMASQRSAEAADPVLARLGLSKTQREAAAHAIAAHSYSAGIPPETPEARILRDADRLDALGAIGIARMMLVSGALGRPLYDPDDPFATTRSPDDTLWAIDHFQTKLVHLPKGMLTETGKRLAHERLAYMQDYLGQLRHEVDATSS